VGAFRTGNENDILNIPDPNRTGFGYFANVGATLRQGFETSVNYRIRDLALRASYTFIDATFQSAFALASHSPSADANGLIYVYKGAQLPMIPRNRVKLGGDWEVTPRATLGADLLFVGAQRYVGDESNQQPKLPAYFTVSLNASYKALDNVTLFAKAENLFDRRYASYGTFFNTGDVFGAFSDPRSVSPARPLSVYGGVRVTF
jgi:outer membrane receptor protein involved in Fe transport